MFLHRLGSSLGNHIAIVENILTLKRWNHIALTFDGATHNATLWVDSLPVFSTVDVDDFSIAAALFKPTANIGCRTATGTPRYYLDGSLACWAMYGYALNRREIKKFRQECMAGMCLKFVSDC